MREVVHESHSELRRRSNLLWSTEEVSIQHLHDEPIDQLLSSTTAWHFLFIDKGNGTVVIDGTSSDLEAGHILCVPPAPSCKLCLNAQASAILITVDEVVYRTKVLDLLPGNMDSTSSFWRTYYTVRILKHSTGQKNSTMRLQTSAELKSLAKYLGKGGDPALIGAALVILMSPLKRQPLPAAEETTSRPDSITNSHILIEFRVLIEEHYTHNLKIGEYADMLGITPKALLRACHALTGRKAVSLIHDRIIVEATHLLRNSNRTISEIAYNLGFDDVGYFSRFIKMHAGGTPSELRH